MNCLIIEDQPPAQRILKKYINEIGSLSLVGTFSDAIQALHFLQSNPVDLIFLDIHLPKISGIDFLKTLSDPPAIILTTAFSDYALESYEFSVVDYLLKPFSFQRFVKAVVKVSIRNNNKNTNVSDENTQKKQNEIFIKSGYNHIKINIMDIFYIKSDGDYTEIHLSNKKNLSSEPLRYWLTFLNEYNFVRVHKSYIIHIPKIAKVSGNQIYLHSEIIIPLGRAYKASFTKRFLK